MSTGNRQRGKNLNNFSLSHLSIDEQGKQQSQTCLDLTSWICPYRICSVDLHLSDNLFRLFLFSCRCEFKTLYMCGWTILSSSFSLCLSFLSLFTFNQSKKQRRQRKREVDPFISLFIVKVNSLKDFFLSLPSSSSSSSLCTPTAISMMTTMKTMTRGTEYMRILRDKRACRFSSAWANTIQRQGFSFDFFLSFFFFCLCPSTYKC